MEDVFDKKDVEAARVEMEKVFYGTSFEDYLAKSDATGEAESTDPTRNRGSPHYGETEHGRPQFPTGIAALDRLIEKRRLSRHV